MYVLGVGVAGGMTLKASLKRDNPDLAPADRPEAIDPQRICLRSRLF